MRFHTTYDTGWLPLTDANKRWLLKENCVSNISFWASIAVSLCKVEALSIFLFWYSSAIALTHTVKNSSPLCLHSSQREEKEGDGTSSIQRHNPKVAHVTEAHIPSARTWLLGTVTSFWLVSAPWCLEYLIRIIKFKEWPDLEKGNIPNCSISLLLMMF